MTSLKQLLKGEEFFISSSALTQKDPSVMQWMEGHGLAFATFILNTVRGLTAFKKFLSSSLVLQHGRSQEQGTL